MIDMQDLLEAKESRFAELNAMPLPELNEALVSLELVGINPFDFLVEPDNTIANVIEFIIAVEYGDFEIA